MAMTALEVHERWVALLGQHLERVKSEYEGAVTIDMRVRIAYKLDEIRDIMADALNIGNDLIRDALGHLPAATAPLETEQQKETNS